VKSAGAYLCPSDTSTVNAVCSYGYNSSFVYASGTAYNSPPVGLALSKFTMPSKTVMFFEMMNSGSASTPNVYSISGQQYQAGADIVPIAPGNTVHFVGNSPSGNGLGDVTQDPWDYSWNYSTTPHVQYATGYLATDGWTRSAAKLAQNFSGPAGRHNLGSNFVMTDGHVKWITPELVMAGRQRGSFDCSHNSQAYAYSPDCATYTFTATFAAY
jgi:prepilin-type processing-associated H-X9-DG protein